MNNELWTMSKKDKYLFIVYGLTFIVAMRSYAALR
jgi:hypothetical protein